MKHRDAQAGGDPYDTLVRIELGLFDYLTKALGAAVADGHLRADLDAETAALRLTSLMDGLQLQWLLDRSVDMAGAIRGTLVEWMTPTGRAAFEACTPRRVPVPDSPERP